ncbi:MAG: RNA-directed DNA polymerase [Methylococcales bacterium]
MHLHFVKPLIWQRHADFVLHLMLPANQAQNPLGVALRYFDRAWESVDTSIDSGDGVLDSEYSMQYFPGDDLLAACRPRGLPIGNLTSQFWSNCYLNPFDLFVKRELGCCAYLRYVDDFALFSDSKKQLWVWKQAIIERLQQFRLVIHESTTQVLPVSCGIPWLGFVVYPTHRKLKARKVRYASQHLIQRVNALHSGQISCAELNMSIKGWVNHVSYADTWGLRLFVFNRLKKQHQKASHKIILTNN